MSISEQLLANKAPCVHGEEIVFTLDAVSRAYDLSAVAFGADFRQGGDMFVKMIPEGADCYYAFSDATKTIDETAALAAGAAVAFSANACDRIVKDAVEYVRINRTKHQWLMLKGSGAGKLRLRRASHITGTSHY